MEVPFQSVHIIYQKRCHLKERDIKRPTTIVCATTLCDVEQTEHVSVSGNEVAGLIGTLVKFYAKTETAWR